MYTHIYLHVSTPLNTRVVTGKDAQKYLCANSPRAKIDTEKMGKKSENYASRHPHPLYLKCFTLITS